MRCCESENSGLIRTAKNRTEPLNQLQTDSLASFFKEILERHQYFGGRKITQSFELVSLSGIWVAHRAEPGTGNAIRKERMCDFMCDGKGNTAALPGRVIENEATFGPCPGN